MPLELHRAGGIVRELGLQQRVAGSHHGYAALVEQLCADGSARDALRSQSDSREAA